jgi:hypothetical protein
VEVSPVYADCFASVTMAWGAADICGNLRLAGDAVVLCIRSQSWSYTAPQWTHTG